jgi:hypothetical protein
MSRRTTCLAASITMALVLGPLARAEEAGAQALAIQASKAIHEGDRRGAISLLEKAYGADPSPDYLERIAELYEALAGEQGDSQDVRMALLNYGRCLAAEKNAVESGEIQARMRRLRQQLSDVSVEPGPESTPAAATPPPARPAVVAVHFIADGARGPLHITVGGRTCDVPCTILLAPGPYVVTTSGSDEIKVSLLVQEAAGTVRLTTSGNRFLLPGVTLTVAGALVATTLWSFRYACTPNLDLTLSPCQTANLALWPTLGGLMFFTGVGFLGYYGSHTPRTVMVDRDGPQAGGSHEQPHWQLATVGVIPTKNGAAAGVGFTF